MFSKWNRVLVTAAVAALVSACGGDDGDASPVTTDGSVTTTTPAADKYVGSWRSGCFFDGSESAYMRETVTLTKTGDNALSLEFVVRNFGADTTCATLVTSETFTGTATITAQTTATYGGSAREFDQIQADIVSFGQEHWLVGILSDGRLLVDFEDDPQPTTYPTDPNTGNTLYTKLP